MAYTRTIGVVDYVVMCAVLLVSASVGVIFSRTGGRQKTTREYLLANRDMGFLPVALSIIVSYISGIMILGYTTEIYQHGIQIVMFNLFNILAYVISAFTFVPFIRKLQITSSFEYLERRYRSKTVRRLGSLLGILSATLYLGTATNATATAVEAGKGWLHTHERF
ncbi:putative sodium-dependent multivitamin transporter [Lingula anatina]|uniref:Sodium-dependent multivitamin transporter n=1 Tax=Lingula anatina TaxID=7574 RepID=A0A2R2MK76_LINAN|nr:putative sodium-dependent multivitamin transporter [Lingula anatina]|eukprot:XP_023930462.1 putative sodium-dependent multivitamin transporter [Lingula anatina]